MSIRRVDGTTGSLTFSPARTSNDTPFSTIGRLFRYRSSTLLKLTLLNDTSLPNLRRQQPPFINQRPLANQSLFSLLMDVYRERCLLFSPSHTWCLPHTIHCDIHQVKLYSSITVIQHTIHCDIHQRPQLLSLPQLFQASLSSIEPAKLSQCTTISHSPYYLAAWYSLVGIALESSCLLSPA